MCCECLLSSSVVLLTVTDNTDSWQIKPYRPCDHNNRNTNVLDHETHCTMTTRMQPDTSNHDRH
jgi:hypothetical protein